MCFNAGTLSLNTQGLSPACAVLSGMGGVSERKRQCYFVGDAIAGMLV